MGIYSLATVTAAGGLAQLPGAVRDPLRARHFRMPKAGCQPLAKQLIAALAMAAALYFLREQLGASSPAATGSALIGVGALVGVGGGIVYFGVAWVIGGDEPRGHPDPAAPPEEGAE
jgi:hypothetical protein